MQKTVRKAAMILVCWIFTTPVAGQPAFPEPTYGEVRYGDHERDRLDFWRAETGGEKAPLLVFFHGGGFRNGDKRANLRKAEVMQFLAEGISFASVNYPFLHTTRLDSIMLHAARAIQYLRSRANEWGIDPDRIAVTGNSAGAGISLWLGAVDDLADPSSPDPVSRQSTRVQAVVARNAQASYDFMRWPAILDIPADLFRASVPRPVMELYRLRSAEQLLDPALVPLRHTLDMPSHLDGNDPPAMLETLRKVQNPPTTSDLIHHPKHAVYYKERCDEAGVRCVAVTADTPETDRITALEFVKDVLGVASGASR